MKFTTKFNRVDAGKKAVKDALESQTISAMELLRDLLAKSLDAGGAIQSDTHALAKSLYIKATGRDDYDAALSAARAAFIQNPSRHRNQSNPEAAKKQFDSIVAAREMLGQPSEHVFSCAVATMLAYGTHWETHGERPWMLPGTLDAIDELHAHFSELRGQIKLS